MHRIVYGIRSTIYLRFGLMNGSTSFFFRIGGGGLAPLPGRCGGRGGTYTGAKLASSSPSHPCDQEQGYKTYVSCFSTLSGGLIVIDRRICRSVS
jgi:hypothetical protein